ncbi:hypothetical protein [Ectobacillus ponti]|uniref:Uncharacterized protein n=1 Tax=Ectobacillus ponti TaxID=2961894 RepID=A0AA41X9X6_9BACI|nr:hypothetical protein [Ectobacillus ponti]MCP8969605.1 hypothetical protein [Ectobacillus ponti]
MWSCDETIRCVVEQNREKWNNHNHQIPGSGTKKSKNETIFLKYETKELKSETITLKNETIPPGSLFSLCNFPAAGKQFPTFARKSVSVLPGKSPSAAAEGDFSVLQRVLMHNLSFLSKFFYRLRKC